jgi:hypothetical protein
MIFLSLCEARRRGQVCLANRRFFSTPQASSKNTALQRPAQGRCLAFYQNPFVSLHAALDRLVSGAKATFKIGHANNPVFGVVAHQDSHSFLAAGGEGFGGCEAVEFVGGVFHNEKSFARILFFVNNFFQNKMRAAFAPML